MSEPVKTFHVLLVQQTEALRFMPFPTLWADRLKVLLQDKAILVTGLTLNRPEFTFDIRYAEELRAMIEPWVDANCRSVLEGAKILFVETDASGRKVKNSYWLINVKPCAAFEYTKEVVTVPFTATSAGSASYFAQEVLDKVLNAQ